MEKKKKRVTPAAVAGIVLCVIFIPIIIINLVLIISSYINQEELPGVFGIKPAVVLSGSMEPAIKPGDLIFIHDIRADELKKDDVICYLLSGKAVTHRIVEITAGEDGKRQYITQGDANNAEDQAAVTEQQIQGIWKGGRVGGLGDVILFMQSTIGMILFIICPLLLFFLWDIWRRRRMDKAEIARTAELEAELAALKSRREENDHRADTKEP
ncbi:signal peptidase I [Ruminococcus gauvreauii]|uniref:Signal peptidase I n=1 Tax=Ruminococcus gauvreauii TaxID=438033 RepID=A0ABY5VBR7_9FIRM|nr:signal peptidase I [Ruminococcus gauvreauii]UWP57992.1 signal peptidase I [Ruminococcus gauvreauii]